MTDTQLEIHADLAVAWAETKTWAIRSELLLGGVARYAGAVLPLHAAGGNGSSKGGGVSVVSLKGVITPEPSFLAMLFGDGGGGLKGFMSDLRSAMADPDTQAVVIDVDSPGGLVDLVPESAAEIRQLREDGDKPIVAVANTQMASAAYWLASQADEVVVSKSGEAGSVGVYSLHRDLSGMAEQMGIKHTLISAGKYKTDGNPFEPLSDDALEFEQSAVQDYYDLFTADIAAGRGVEVPKAQVKEGLAFGGGRMFRGERAVAAGLADKVASLPETIARLSKGRRVLDAVKNRADELAPPVYSQEQRLSLAAFVASRTRRLPA
jgi:signal peptide peptidase SppA